MSKPDEKPHFEELAALHAVDLLDDAGRKELLDAAQRDPEIQALMRDFAGTSASLAFEAPQIAPPPQLKQAILDQLPAGRSTAKIISFPQWIPYAIAACLMILGISQVQQITALKSQLASVSEDASKLRESNALVGLRVATLEAKDAATDASYASSKILVAWDPYRHQGVVSMNSLPVAPAGHDYQLWVLDPAAAAPISAGVVTGSRSFGVKPVSTPNPGFAVSLEPTGGSPEPTGPILFAVAPGA